VDTLSNVWVADSGNNAVKLIAAPGFNQSQTVWSGGTHPMGIAVDSSQNVYVADTGAGRVVRLTVNLALPVQ
jgi:DNA-binding beta-propeller fold protein YncE